MALQFTFDPNRCTGCQACVVACWMEHRARQAGPWREVHAFNAFRHPALPVIHASLACHHCDEPACLLNCPAAAYTRDPATGAVTVHGDRCLGCRYCTWACPHDAPRFNPAAGTIEKCTFCAERLAAGQEPACVARCPVEALGCEPRTEARAQVLPGLVPSGTRPAIRVAPLRRDAPPELGIRPPAPVLAGFLEALLAVPEPKITLRGEWTLVLFTTVAATLAASMGAAGFGGPVLPAWAFLLAGGAAMGLSAAHLGRPGRAWRALLNLRTSWLSREILLVALFLGAGTLGLAVPALAPARPAAAALGFAALFAIDRIYRVALKTGPWNLHSAHVLLNGLYLLGLLARIWPLAVGAGVLKLGLYLHRARHFAGTGRATAPALQGLRLLAGFGAPLLLAPGHPISAAAAALLGDLLDRCEYYAQLVVPTPRGHLVETLRRALDQPSGATSSARARLAVRPGDSMP
jgi:Fe-S-cluster-containing dehydrogenase component